MAEITRPPIYGEEVTSLERGVDLSPTTISYWRYIRGERSRRSLAREPLITVIASNLGEFGVPRIAEDAAEGTKELLTEQGKAVYTPQTESEGRRYLNKFDNERAAESDVIILAVDVSGMNRLRTYYRSEKIDPVFTATLSLKGMIGFFIGEAEGSDFSAEGEVRGPSRGAVNYDHFLINQDPARYPQYTAAAGIANILGKYEEQRQQMLTGANPSQE